MKYKLLVFVCSFLISGSFAGTIGECVIDDDDELNLGGTNIYKVDINDEDQFEKSFSFNGSLQLISTNIEEDTAVDYTTVALEDNQLVLRTNDYFLSDFEKNMKGESPNPIITIKRTVGLKCADVELGFVFTLNVADTNNHPPTFELDTYTYKLPSPVTPSVDLTSVGVSIIVEDLDFSNTDITFDVSGSNMFTIETVKVDGSSETQRNYKGVLKVTQFQTLTENTELTVTATDNGTPTQTSTPVTIKIEVDTENSLPSVPSFLGSLFTFEYSFDDKTLIGPKINVTGITSEVVTVTLTDQSGAESSYFEGVFDDAKTTITIQPKGTELDKSSTPVLVLTLTVTLDGKDDQKSSAVVLINLPTELVVKAPTFLQPYYTATYKVDGDTHTVELTEEIKLSENADVTLEDDPRFRIENVGGKWQPQVKTPLEDADLKAGGDIIMTLHATVTGDDDATYDGYATLVVELPAVEEIKTPKFTKNIYSATYKSDSENGVVTLDGDDTIDATSDGQTVNIAVASSEPATTYFELTKTGDVWGITVKEKPSDEVLNSGEEYVLVLEATIQDNADVDPSYSTLIITIPAPEVPPVPKFGASYYIAEYKLGDVSDTVEISNGPITIDADVTPEIVTGTYSDYFSISSNSENNYQVNVNEKLPQDVLDEGDDIILTLKATIGDSSESGVSILVIALPKSTQSETPIFSSAFYEGIYKVDESGTATVNLRTPIQISSPLDKEISINFHEVSDVFDIVADGDSWVINVNKTLSVEDYAKHVEIFTLQAVIAGGSTDVGKSTLIIHLPDIPTVPKFAKAFYSAVYNVESDGTATVTLNDGPIQLSSSDSVTIDFVDPYGSSFDFNLDGDPQITVATNLEQSIIDENQEILLTLKASIDSSTEAETTVVALKLPHVDVQKTLKFNNPSYEITYNVVNEIPTLDYNGQTISLENGDANVKITVQEPYDSNFQLELNSEDNTYTITILSGLEPDILATESDVLLILEATLEGYEDGFATVLLDLPKKEATGDAPTFTESTYTGQYILGEENQNGRTDSVDVNLITVEGVTAEQVAVTFAEISDHFDLVLNDDKSGYIVQIKTKLDGDTLLKSPDIVLVMEAKIEGVEEVGKATLVITLPKETTPISFSQPVYTAKYNNDDTSNPTVDLSEEIQLTNIYAVDLTVNLSAPAGYEDSFSLGQESPYTIAVNNPLEDEILDAGRDIVLTLIASSGETSLASATVVITLPEIPKSPKFTLPTYRARYEQAPDSKYEVQLIDKIETDAEDPSNVKITVQQPYDADFEVQYEENAYKVNVLGDGLDVNSITDPVVYVTLSTDDSKEPDVATLAIKLPDKTENIVPTFSDVIYFATYNDDDTVSDYAPAITITSEKAVDTDVTVTGQYGTNFQAALEENSWILNVIQPLDRSAISEIYVTLDATLSGSAGTGTATVILNIAGREDLRAAPKFDEPVYSATYSIDENGEYQLTADVVKIVSTYEPQVVVTLEDDYKNVFGITRDETSTEWTLTKTADLDEAIVKENTELIVRLTAHLDDSVEDGVAVFVVKLPKEQEVIAFGDTYYEATYQVVDGDDNDEVALKDSGAKITVSEGVSVEVIGYNEYFAISCPSTECTLSVDKDLTSDILESSTDLLLVLNATKDDLSATATVVIALPLQEKARAPEFTQAVYTATYKDGELTDASSISIQGDSTGVEVNIDENSVIGEQKATEYLTIAPDGDHWTVTVSASLPSDIVTKEAAVLVNLIATKTDVTPTGEAGLVIKLPKTQAATSFNFKENAYLADYAASDDKATITPAETVTIEGDLTDVEVSVAGGEYGEYFKADLNSADGTVTISAEGVIDGSILETEVAITFNIVASKGGESDETVIVARLPKKVSPTSIYFSQVAYLATYEVANQEFVVTGDIKLEQDLDHKAVITLDGDYQQYFEYNRATDSDVINLVIKDNALPEDVLTDSVIYVNVVATKDGEETTTKVVITLLKETPGVSTFEFDDTVYMASYETNGGKPILNLNKNVTINGTLENVVLELRGDYATYFDGKFDSSTGLVEITVKTPLTNEILENDVALSVSIEATKDTESHVAAFVVQLPKKVSPTSIYFSRTTYMANYTVEDDNPSLTIDDIELINDDGTAVITLDSDYKDYFTFTREDNFIKLSLNDSNPLPDEVYTKSVIYVDVLATNGSETARTKVIITIPPSAIPDTFAFEDTVYMANYELDEDETLNATLSLESKIKITGELEDVVVALSGGYNKYFHHTFDATTGEVDITLAEDKIETNTLESEVAVTINIEASKNTEHHSAIVVVKLPKKVSATTLNFEKLAYVVEYKVEDDTATIVQEDIILNGDNDASATITLSDYTEYFNVTRDEENPDKILVVLKKDLESVILDNQAVLSADIVADGVDQTKAKLLIKLPQKIVPTTFHFEQTSYMADYEVNDDGSVSFTLSDSIEIKGEPEGVKVDIEDGNEYFAVKYNEDYTVTVSSIKPLDDSYLDDSVMSINIKATKGDETTKAVLVIRLPKSRGSNNGGDSDDDDGSNTGLIAAVAVLAVLLVASLVGSAVFYYLKFKRAGNFSNTESPRQTFRQNPQASEASRDFY